ncbi:MAG: hypothetical protein JXR77_18820 [Lentisphaeria bacterium]|nr:hypothetical protein [Lentisphaeria bacterium]
MRLCTALPAWCILAAAGFAAQTTAIQRAEALFRECEALSRTNRKTEALAKAEEAAAELDRAATAKEKISRGAMEGLRLAARLAREDFLDHAKSLHFCERMTACADSDYWRVPARLETALTYRAMGDFAKAREQYDAIAAADERYRAAMLLPRAEMVRFDMGDRQRGTELLEEALRNEAVNGRERYTALTRCAEGAVAEGRRDEALRWYAMAENLPNRKPEERTAFLPRVWYEMGRLEEGLGHTAAAKDFYRRAMDLHGGDMRWRARARDALEAIEYFE